MTHIHSIVYDDVIMTELHNGYIYCIHKYLSLNSPKYFILQAQLLVEIV